MTLLYASNKYIAPILDQNLVNERKTLILKFMRHVSFVSSSSDPKLAELKQDGIYRAIFNNDENNSILYTVKNNDFYLIDYSSELSDKYHPELMAITDNPLSHFKMYSLPGENLHFHQDLKIQKLLPLTNYIGYILQKKINASLKEKNLTEAFNMSVLLVDELLSQANAALFLELYSVAVSNFLNLKPSSMTEQISEKTNKYFYKIHQKLIKTSLNTGEDRHNDIKTIIDIYKRFIIFNYQVGKEAFNLQAKIVASISAIKIYQDFFVNFSLEKEIPLPIQEAWMYENFLPVLACITQTIEEGSNEKLINTILGFMNKMFEIMSDVSSIKKELFSSGIIRMFVVIGEGYLTLFTENKSYNINNLIDELILILGKIEEHKLLFCIADSDFDNIKKEFIALSNELITRKLNSYKTQRIDKDDFKHISNLIANQDYIEKNKDQIFHCYQEVYQSLLEHSLSKYATDQIEEIYTSTIMKHFVPNEFLIKAVSDPGLIKTTSSSCLFWKKHKETLETIGTFIKCFSR